MTLRSASVRPADEPHDRLVTDAVAGDDRAFSTLAAHHRPVLKAHCRRMLRNADADDAVQETLLRAWRTRTSFEHRSSFGWWLRRIATNACIDVARRNNRSPEPIDPSDDDRLGVEAPADPARQDPAAVVAAREALAQAYLVTIRALPPRQRAVLVLRDVLRYSAADTATMLGGSVASVNSALQRARAGLHEHRRCGGVDVTPAPTAAEQALTAQLIHAHRHHDTTALITILTGHPPFRDPPPPVR